MRSSAHCRRLGEMEAEHARSTASLQARVEAAVANAQRTQALEQTEIKAAAWADRIRQDAADSSAAARMGSATASNAGVSARAAGGSSSGSGGRLPAGPSTPERPGTTGNAMDSAGAGSAGVFVCPYACGEYFTAADDLQVLSPPARTPCTVPGHRTQPVSLVLCASNHGPWHGVK